MNQAYLISFRATSFATLEVMLIGLCGFLLAKRGIFSQESIRAISRLLITLVMPFFIFTKLLNSFNFTDYPNWWFFPVLSLVINFLGFALSFLFVKLDKSIINRRDFISLNTFQNSGYLVLGLVGALFSGSQLDQMLIYIFLFLLGFNLLLWSFGVWFLVKKDKSQLFEYELLFSPTVIAIILALGLVFFKFDKVIPNLILKPMTAIGDTAIVLAMFVVGANIGLIRAKRQLEKKAIFYTCLIKLVILPALALFIISKINLPSLIGLFIVMQCAVPSATTLSVIAHGYEKDTHLIDHGIFWTHLISLITLPFFLAFKL